MRRMDNVIKHFLANRHPDSVAAHAALGARTPAGLYIVAGDATDALKEARASVVSNGWSVREVRATRELIAVLQRCVTVDGAHTLNESEVLLTDAETVASGGGVRAAACVALLHAALEAARVVVICVSDKSPARRLLSCMRVERVRAPAAAPTSTSVADWSSLGGLEAVKARLRVALEWPRTHGSTMQRLGVRASRGVLLHGPPGCGKTSLVRAAAAAGGAEFVSLSAADVYSCYVGEAERIVRDSFAHARRKAPCILFLDEVDALAGASRGSHVSARVLATLLTEMDGVSGTHGVVVVAATNRLNEVDAALRRPGRFDDVLEVPLPDLMARESIVQRFFAHGVPLSRPHYVSDVARLTDGASGAVVKGVCRAAAMTAAREAWVDESERVCVTWRHLEQALKETR